MANRWRQHIERPLILAPASPALYTTTFPADENPLLEGGIWTTGDNNGSSIVLGPQTSGGKCFSQAADGMDYIAVAAGRFSTTKHFAEGVVRRQVGYTAPDTHEIELQLGFTVSSGLTKGYEMNFWFGGTTLQPVRWNAPGDYYFGMTVVSGSWGEALAEGDVVRAVFDSTSGSPVITISLNGVQKIVFTDEDSGKILTGSPGFAFFVRPGSGVDLQGYCWNAMTVGSA